VLLGLFLVVKDNSSDASDFDDRTNLASAKDSALRVPIESGGEMRDCRTSNQKILISLDSRSVAHNAMILKLFSGIKPPNQQFRRFRNRTDHVHVQGHEPFELPDYNWPPD
jgi:hypothetical protein